MRNLLILAAAAALLIPALADARDARARPGFGAAVQAQQQGTQKGAARFQRGERDLRRGERDEHRHGRLTDDERRELHRDLDRADREIYRRKASRQPPPLRDR